MSLRRIHKLLFPAKKQKTAVLSEKPKGMPVSVKFEYCEYHIELYFDKRIASWRKVRSPKDGGRQYSWDYFDEKTYNLNQDNIEALYKLIAVITDMIIQKNTSERLFIPLPLGATSDTIIHVVFENESLHYKNVWVDENKKTHSISRENVPDCIIRLFDYLLTAIISPAEEYYRKRSEEGYDLYFIVAELNSHGVFELMNGYMLDGNMYVHKEYSLFVSDDDNSFQFRIENYTDDSCTIAVFAYNPYATGIPGDLDSCGRKMTVPYDTPILVETSSGFAGVLGGYVIMIAKDTKVLMSGLQNALGYDTSSRWDNGAYERLKEKCPIRI